MNLLSTVRARKGMLALASTLCAGTLTFTLTPVSALLFQEEAKTYTLERKFEKNSVDRYRILADVLLNGPATNGLDINLKINVLMKQTVKEVKENGSAIIASEAEKATVDLGDGQESDALSLFPKITQTLDKRLRLLDSKEEGVKRPNDIGGKDLLSVFTRAQASFFPSKSVKVGETWKIEDKSEKPKVSITGKGNVIKAEKIGEIETLQVKVAADMTSEENGGGKSHIEGTANLDPINGKVVKMKGTLNVETGAVGKTKADFDFALVTGKEKEAEKKETETKEKKEGEKGR